MNCTDAINLIHSLSTVRYTPSLCRMEKLMPYLDDIHKKMKFIHIGGTNGKGSSSTMIADILTNCGYKTGLFTSPYVEYFGERIRINGEPIPDDKLTEYTEKLHQIKSENNLSLNEFEFITALALMYFYDEKCDITVLEVGLGGEFDPTNIIPKSIFSMLTSISLDHTKILGDTIESIAKSKAGIAKSGGSLIINSAMPKKAIDVISEIAESKNTRLLITDVDDISVCYEKGGSKVMYDGQEYRISLLGKAQPINLLSVLEGVKILRKKGFDIPENLLQKSLATTKMSARMEHFSIGGKEIILDSGHNQESIENLVKSLQLHQFTTPATVVFTSMSDKDYSKTLPLLSEISDEIIFTHIEGGRCELAENLFEEAENFSWKRQICNDPEMAIGKAFSGENQTIVICGSFYLSGKVRKLFTKT